MAEMLITQTDMLRSTLFHIQLNQCQYIDHFPEAVTNIFHSMYDGKKLKPYDDMKRKLYGIKTSFFDINEEKVVKRDFYLGLYNRIHRKVQN